MAGVVLENLSNRKLAVLVVTLFLVLLVFFLIGGLIAPAPANVINVLATNCIDEEKTIKSSKWFLPRAEDPHNACHKLPSLHDAKAEKVSANQVVFAALFPLPRGGQVLDMSRWFQNMISVLQLDFVYNPQNPMSENPVVRMDVRLGCRDKGDAETDWKELASSTEERRLDCTLKEAKEGEQYDCDVLPFFELGSVHYDYYLVNIRLPTIVTKNINVGIGSMEDVHVIVIHQNGGFTKVWFSMKTVLFPVILIVLVWFWRRVQMQSRPTNLLERTLFSLGIMLSILNCPIEWFTLRFDIPFMLLVTDIRQGAFYAMLLSFWIIFAGEHMMDQMERNKLMAYWKHLSIVVFGCLCLFVFEMCERGVQLTNPFYSIWLTTTGTRLALSFIILAGIAACCYFIFLCWMVFRVFRNISAKKSSLPQMSSVRRKYYMGLISRFKFLMLATLLCAALTVIFFIISQVSEGQWKWGDEGIQLEYSSAFLTGVYGMWNVYVFALLSLYAPSHKTVTDLDSTSDSREEEVQLTTIPSDSSAMTTFTSKAAAD